MQTIGYRTIIATSPAFADAVSATNAAFAPLRPDFLNDEIWRVEQFYHHRSGAASVMRDLLMRSIHEMYSDIETLIDRFRPCAIITNHAVLAAGTAAESSGIPWISITLSPFGFHSVFDPPVIAGYPHWLTRGPQMLRPFWGRMILAGAKRATLDWSSPLHALRQELGLPPLDRDPLYEGQHSRFLTLAAFSIVIGGPQPDWPERALQTGFLFSEDNDRPRAADGLIPELQRFLRSGPPPLIFTLGSAAVQAADRFYQEAAIAARALGMRAVLLIGKKTSDIDALRPYLNADIISIPYAPYRRLFLQASLIIHHGGIGTTAEALRAGKPSVIVPRNFDQPDNADRIRRQGLGNVVLRRRCNASSLQRAIGTLLRDPTIEGRLLDASRRISTENGAGTAAQLIQTALKNA